MRVKSVCTAAAAGLAMAVLGSAAASADVPLPIPGTCGTTAGTNCLVFDDFTVYSLALLNVQAGFKGKIGPKDPFFVPTNGVDLHDALVVGTGVNGAGSNNTDLLGAGVVDNAFNTPNAAQGTTNFQMDNTNAGTQGNLIPGNLDTTWDVNVGSLVDFLAGGKMVFYFNLNQTNTTSYLNDPEDALGWLAVTLTDTKGSNGSITFYLDGDACNGVLGGLNSPNCDPSQSYKGTMPPLSQNDFDEQNILPADVDHDEWAYIHGQICVSPAGGVVNFGACAQGDNVNSTVDQNLGAGNAAFALYSDDLQKWLLSGDYDKMSVDLRMAAVDNGYEQLIIRSIPEPITVMLFGAGLFMVTALRRRKFKTA